MALVASSPRGGYRGAGGLGRLIDSMNFRSPRYGHPCERYAIPRSLAPSIVVSADAQDIDYDRGAERHQQDTPNPLSNHVASLKVHACLELALPRIARVAERDNFPLP